MNSAELVMGMAKKHNEPRKIVRRRAQKLNELIRDSEEEGKNAQRTKQK